MKVEKAILPDEKLPKYVYEKKGVLYFQRRGWQTKRLHAARGTPDLLVELRGILHAPVSSPEPAKGAFDDQKGGCFFKSIEAGAKKRSRRNNRQHTLPDGWMAEQLVKQSGRCAITGVEFKKTRSKRSPLAPSIDRINSAEGYTPENCRLVTYIANCARNQFSDAEFYSMCLAAVRHKLDI